MIIHPPSVGTARDKLLQQVQAGALTKEQAFQQALELDPCDGVSLLALTVARRAAGDLDEAERYCWRGLEAHPCEYRFYIALASLVARHKKSTALVDGLMELGLRKVLGNEEELNDYLKDGPEGLDRAAIEQLAAALASRSGSGPQRVSDLLLPHRLIHELQMAPAGRLDRGLVDRVVKCGGACVPLLIGMLRGWFEDELPEDVDFPAEASLALIGEIGDPAALPALVEFFPLDHEAVSAAARWATRRIVTRQPAQALQVFRVLAQGAHPYARSVMAAQVALMPATEGAGEFLTGLIEDLGSLPKAVRDELFLLVAVSLLRVEGERGPAIVKAAFGRHSRELTQKGRARCYQLLKSWEGGPRDEPRQDQQTVYDFCCWRDREEKEEREPEALPPGRGPDPAQRALRQRMIAFGEGALRDREVEQAARVFFGPAIGAIKGGGDDEAAFTEWLYHDYVCPRLGRTLVEDFLERNRSQLTPAECGLLERWSRSRYSLFEVRRVEPGEGIEIEDLLTGEVLFARDVSASRRAAQWDCLLLRVEEAEEGMELTGVGLSVPRHYCEPLRKWILEDQRKSGLPWPRYLRANSHHLRRKALELYEKAASSLKVVSAEGDPVVFSKAAYGVLDEAALMQALGASDELERDPEEGRFVWFEAPGGQSGTRRLLGSVRVEAGRLVLECHSRERLARGRELLESLAGAALRHQEDEFTGVETAMRRAKPSGPPPKSGIPPEIERELVGKAMAAHYRTWPDTPLPALGGQTPRQAVATFEGRKQVVDLLKLIENGEAHKRKAGQAWYDVAELKAELQLEF